MEKPKRGGNREGSGRPPVPYKTKSLQFKVREELAEDLKKDIKILIHQKTKEYLNPPK